MQNYYRLPTVGETLIPHRFPAGTVEFVAKLNFFMRLARRADPCPVHIPPGSRLMLYKGRKIKEEVTVKRGDTLRFYDGGEWSFQRLPSKLRARVLSLGAS